MLVNILSFGVCDIDRLRSYLFLDLFVVEFGFFYYRLCCYGIVGVSIRCGITFCIFFVL